MNSNSMRAMTDLSLIVADSNGDSEMVERALKEGKLFSVCLKGYVSHLNVSNSPFAIAICNGFEDIVRLFLRNGANVNARFENGGTALHVAARKGDQKMVELFVENAADVNFLDENGYSPLIFATENDFEEIVKLLIVNGADVNARFHGKFGGTALHIAAQKGNQKMVELLLENAADMNALDRTGFSPLMLATENEFEEIVKLLMAKGAGVNARSRNDYSATALHVAARNGNQKIVELFFDNSADVNTLDQMRCPPLILAINRPFDNDKTALHIAARNGNQKMVELLLKNAADVNAFDQEGNPPLFYAIGRRNEKIVRLFLENEADISTRYLPKEETVLHVAAKNGREKLVVEEFSRIKMAKIGNSEFFWHDILTKSTHELAILLANENLYKTLNSFDFLSQFSIYGEAMESFFEHAKRRRNLLEAVKPNCCDIFPEKIYDCIPKILSYLSDKDLFDFRAAFCQYDLHLFF